MSVARNPATGSIRVTMVAVTLLTLLAGLLVLAPPAPVRAEPAQLANACPGPVPATAFTDASEGPHAAAIRCLVAWDITQGITATRYEPSRTVVRAQMASFLVRMIRAAGSAVPTPSASQFNDVDGVHRDNIEALAALQIARGTGAARFSPSQEVTRAQMAIFIDRTLSHLGARSPSVTGAPFADVAAGSVAADAIGRLEALGVVQGVSEDRYDPGRPVTRAQMASFLMRASDVLVDDGVAIVPYLGSGDGVTPPPVRPDPTPDNGDLSRTGFPASCPALDVSLEAINRATYQVGGLFVNAQGQVGVARWGTAWAVRPQLLVTNGHVADEFTDLAQRGIALSQAVAINSRTGELVRLRRAIVHPEWTERRDALRSPDVALFTTQEQMPHQLDLAGASSVLGLGDDMAVVGFPADVDQFLPDAIPTASSLTGQITALRSFTGGAVTRANLDIYQHQAPTTPGTSGGAIVHCGLVAAINNAGTVQMVVGPDGQPQRQPVSANNFGIHVRHIHGLLNLFDNNVVGGIDLPVPATQAGGGGGGVPPTGPTPSDPNQVLLVVSAQVAQQGRTHQFAFEIRADLSIRGVSQWPGGGEFQLTGQANQQGQFIIQDNAQGAQLGAYEGVIQANGSVIGVYFEPNSGTSEVWQFTGQIVGP